MNFTELYKTIKNLDEATQEGSMYGYQGVPGLDVPEPGPEPDEFGRQHNGKSEPDVNVEECGPMGPSGMMGMRDQQPDNVSMNLSMNGQGPGGIRDLLDILKDIGNTSSEPDAGPDSSGDLELDIKSMDHPHDEPEHDEEDGLVFGNDLEGVEPPKHYGGQGVPGAKFDLYMQQRKDQLAGQKPVGEKYNNQPDEMYSTVDDVVNMGSNDGRGDNERPKVNGGGNPYAVTSEGIKRQLQNLYYEVKSR
jgi:hypothetical protein